MEPNSDIRGRREPSAGWLLARRVGGSRPVRVDTRAEGTDVVTLRNDLGTGTMLIHEVFPGATLVFNDFRMQRYESEVVVNEDVLCIDHCREGRLESPRRGGTGAVLSAGDIKIDDRREHTGVFRMPLEHYHGATVQFDIRASQRYLDRELRGLNVDLAALHRRFCSGGAYVAPAAPQIERIFAELYFAPSQIRDRYARLKVVELLLLLEDLPHHPATTRREYFSRTQIVRVQRVHERMLADLSRRSTVEELAQEAGLPLTAFKMCFKGIYGLPPFALLRTHRMQRAAALLLDTDLSVADIALTVGYDSPSKFTAAFKSVIHQTPSQYRREPRQ